MVDSRSTTPTSGEPMREAGSTAGRAGPAPLASILAAALAALLAVGVLTARPAAAAPSTGLEAKARATRARLDAGHERLEVLAERIQEATDRGTALLAERAAMERRRRAAARKLARAAAGMDAEGAGPADPDRPMSPLLMVVNPVELAMAALRVDHAEVARVGAAEAKLERLDQAIAARVVDQARTAERLDRERAEAEALAASLRTRLDALDDRLAAEIARQAAGEEAARRAAFDRLVGASGPSALGGGSPSAAARRAVEIALAQRGAPYLWGAEGPARFDCSGLTSFAYAAAGVAIPRVSRAQYAAFAPAGRVALGDLRPGDLVFFASNPASPSTIHHVGMYVGRGLMVEAPYTGATVRTASVMRPGFAGGVRPTAGPAHRSG